MALPLAAGLVTLLAAVGVFARWLALPPRSVCPLCAGATEAVAFPRFARPLERLVRRRWCPACAWTGLGRNGPVLSAEKGPVAHGSGFRWGEDLMPPDLGFTWSAGDGPPAPPPAHPSGFRWRGGRLDAAPDGRRPQGFRWRDSGEEPSQRA